MVAVTRSETAPPLLSFQGTIARLGLGHLREFQKDPWTVLRRFNAECGPIGRAKFFGNYLTIVNEPDLVGELLVGHAASCRKSPIVRAALFPLVGEGLFTSEGQLWRSQRKLMAPLFHPAKVGEFASMMVEAASRSMASWRDGQVIDVGRETTRIAMAIAGKALFDVDTFDEADELGAALTTALHWSAETAISVSLGLQFELAGVVKRVGARLDGPLRERADRAVLALHDPIRLPTARNRRLARALEIIDRRVDRMIAERRAKNGERHDLLSRLLDARDEEGGAAMSDRQLRDEIVTLFVAGHETTATALAWTLYLLGRAPTESARLQTEVDALPDLPASASELRRLQYTQQVFKEAMRLYPPVPVYEREVLEPITLAGHTYATGSFCTVFPWALHHRPEIYPDPDRFDPDRFSPEREDKMHRYSFVPFGAGPRVCMGNHFALLEGPLVLATMLKLARFEALDTEPIGLHPMSATLRPIRPIRMRVHLRARTQASVTGSVDAPTPG
jgi:cytochrome P450